MKYPTRGISKYRVSKQLAVRNKTIHGHIYVNNSVKSLLSLTAITVEISDTTNKLD